VSPCLLIIFGDSPATVNQDDGCVQQPFHGCGISDQNVQKDLHYQVHHVLPCEQAGFAQLSTIPGQYVEIKYRGE